MYLYFAYPGIIVYLFFALYRNIQRDTKLENGYPVLAMDEVLRVDELRIRSIAMEEKRLVALVCKRKNECTSDVLEAVRNVLKHEFGIKLTTVEISDE